MPFPRPPRVVTFDCWSTLIYEVDPGRVRTTRVSALRQAASSLGPEVTLEQAEQALNSAWKRHWIDWRDGVSSGSEEIARWALDELGRPDAATAQALAKQFAEGQLEQEILPLEGARETLEVLATQGIRRALICDTGFSPGIIVRRLLEEAKLLELLEVLIFSDEAGVPKPNPHVFRLALDSLESPAQDAVHVGDIRRTDVAGARGMGMGSVRIRWHNDDTSDHPEADVVAGSHAELRDVLGLGA